MAAFNGRQILALSRASATLSSASRPSPPWYFVHMHAFCCAAGLTPPKNTALTGRRAQASPTHFFLYFFLPLSFWLPCRRKINIDVLFSIAVFLSSPLPQETTSGCPHRLFRPPSRDTPPRPLTAHPSYYHQDAYLQGKNPREGGHAPFVPGNPSPSG